MRTSSYIDGRVVIPETLFSGKVLVLLLFLYSGFVKSRGWVGSVDLTLVAASLLVAFCVLTILFNPRVQQAQIRHFIGYIVFLCFVVFSYLSGEQSLDATTKLMQFTVYGSLSLLASMIFFKEPERLLQFFLFVFVLSVAGGLHELLVSPLAGLIQTESTDSGYQWSSRMAFYSTLIGLFYVRYQENGYIKLVVLFGILVGSLGVVFGGGRQGVLAIVACFAYSLYIAKFRIGRSVLRMGGAITVFVLLVYLIVVFLLDGLLQDPDSAVFSSKLFTFYDKLFFSEDVVSSVLGGRSAIYAESWLMFAENPVLGVGFGGYAEHSVLGVYRHAHNLILELLSETGVLGFSAFLVFWGKIIYSLFSRRLLLSSSAITRLCAYLIVGQLAMMQVSGDLGNNSIIFFFGGLFVVSMEIDKKLKYRNFCER